MFEDEEPDALAQAREKYFAEAARWVGTTCPCCDRFGKIYSRKFNRGMATNLIWLYQHPGFVHLPSIAPRYILKDNQVGKLVFWGLAEPQPNKDDPTKNKSGSWRILPAGRMFVEGRAKIWSHVIEYNQEVLGFKKKKQISISEALGRPFNYRELMRDHP